MDRSIFTNEWDGFAAIEDTSGILYNNYLPKSLIRNEGFRHQYLNRTADLLNSIGKSSNLLSRLDDLKDEIDTEIPSELNRWVPNSPANAWEDELDNVIDFLEDRPDDIRLQAVEAYGLSGVNEITLDVNGSGHLEINTLDLTTYPWSGIYFEEVPIRIKAVPNAGYAFAGWSDPNLPMEAEIEIDVAEYSNLTANFVLGNNDNLNIVINEINYHAPDSVDGGDWIELYNGDTAPANLAGWSFKDESGKSFTLTDNTVLPNGEYIVLVADKEKFQSIYPFINNVVGSFGGINDSGFSLSNGGELIQLFNANGSFMDEVNYLDDVPWPIEADGQGPSLQLIQPDADNALAQNWLAREPTPGSINFRVGQTIDFTSIANQPTDAAPITLIATASSDLPVSFEILSGPATINGNLVTLIGQVGTVSIRATQSGNNLYQAAPPVTQSFIVYAKQDQTIVFPTIMDQPTDASPINLTVTATSSLSVNLELLSGPAILNNNILTLTGAEGTVTIRATQSGNDFYNPAPMVTRSFEVYEKEDQTISFASIDDQPTDASPITLTATSSSGLSVELELLSGPATLNNNILTLTGAEGTVTIRATQSGNDFYNPALMVTRSFEVYAKEDQTISFASIDDQPTDASPLSLIATSSSGLSVNLELLSGPATLNNNILTLTGAEGTVTIRATQSGNDFYNPALMVTRSFEVYAKEDQTISFASIDDQPTDASPLSLIATSSSGLSVELELLSGPATLNNNILTLTGAEGTVTIRATQSGNDFYNPALMVTRSFEVYAKEDQTISFASIDDQPTDASPLSLIATSSSGLSVGLELLSGPAMLNNNILTLTGGEGTVTIRATQSGNDFYNPALMVTRSFEVYAKEDQTISFASIDDQPTDASPLSLTATSSSGLSVELELLSGPAMLNNNILTLTGAEGTVTIRATQSGNDFYNPAPMVTRSFEVYAKEDQTISFASIDDQPTDASPLSLIATSSSGLSVELELLSGPATLNNNILTLTGAEGTVTIRATQSGNDFYNPALMVTRSFEVYAKEDQTISFASIDDQPTDASPLSLIATSSSGLSVGLELLSGPAMLNNNILTLTGGEGTVTIRATQSGNDFYNPALMVTRSFEVYAKEDQTISFASIDDQPTDASPLSLTATSSSGLSVELELLSGPAMLNNNILTLTGAEGTVTIRATQSGNDFYNPAPMVTRSFEVYAKEDQTISFASIDDQPTDALPLILSATSSSGLSVGLELLSGPAMLNDNMLTLTGAEGTVTIQATQSGNNFYNPAPMVIRSFEVYAKEDQTISFESIDDQPTDAMPILLAASASSGLVVGYEILNGPASMIGNTIELDGNEGVVRIRAFQNGNNFYNAATEIIQEFNVYEKESQTIDFLEIPDQFVGTTEVELQASASSGLPVSYQLIGGPAMVSGNTLILDGTVGIVSVQAIQEGDLQFGAAPSIIRSFMVIEQATQSIELSPIPDQPTTAPPIILLGTASSGLSVQYEILSGPAILENGNEVVLNGVEGMVTIQASQPGDVAYAAAPPINISFEVILLDTDFPLDACPVNTDSLYTPYIIGLNFGNIISVSENEGYTNNLEETTMLRRESITPLNVTIEHFADAYLSVWIDYNRNGSFEEDGEVVYEEIVLEGSTNSQVATEIEVPADARIGATRMRVIVQKDDFAEPCLAEYFGEVEDYGIYLEVVTDIMEEEELPLSIYPNPFSNEITINWKVSDYKVMVYNSIGERIYETMTSDLTHIIQTDLWNNGVYILKVMDNKGKMASQVLIK